MLPTPTEFRQVPRRSIGLPSLVKTQNAANETELLQTSIRVASSVVFGLGPVNSATDRLPSIRQPFYFCNHEISLPAVEDENEEQASLD